MTRRDAGPVDRSPFGGAAKKRAASGRGLWNHPDSGEATSSSTTEGSPVVWTPQRLYTPSLGAELTLDWDRNPCLPRFLKTSALR